MITIHSIQGAKASYKDYFQGRFRHHAIGAVGGAINATGVISNFVASKGTNLMIFAMFVFFLAGLSLLVASMPR